MASPNQQYVDLLHDILTRGSEMKDARGQATLRLHTQVVQFSETPLITLRKTAWKNALREFEWFLSGSNRLADLDPKVRHWWQPWDRDGEVPHNYSKQFRHARSHVGGIGYEVDQIQDLLVGLHEHPQSRRHIVTTWNAVDMKSLRCPITNCHGTVIQCFVSPQNVLDLTMYQRSADMVLGTPHNWIQYWAFLLWLARCTGHKPGRFTWIGGDCHIYESHIPTARKIDAAFEDARRWPRPQLRLVPEFASGAFSADLFSMDGDIPEPAITDEVKMIV